jgi:vesicle-fusing ATPase
LIRLVEICTGSGTNIVFSLKFHQEVPPGTIGLSLLQCKWAALSLNQEVEVRKFHFDPDQHTLVRDVLEADFG